MTRPPALVYPEIQELRGRRHQVVHDARFVGVNAIEGNPSVVTFVDMEVVGYGIDAGTGAHWAEVHFVSTPCSFDDDGRPVFVAPVNCMEAWPRRGATYRLISLPGHQPPPRRPGAHPAATTRSTCQPAPPDAHS